MKIMNYSIAICLSMMSFVSCGKIVTVYTPGDNVTKDIEIPGEFTGIVTDGITDVIYTDGKPSITLEATPDVAAKTEVYLKKGNLIVTQVGNNRNNFNGNSRATIKISYPGVNTFKTTGTGDININSVGAQDIKLITEGTGDIECQSIECNSVTAETSGTGDIYFKGLTCDYANFNTSGVGDIVAKGISAGDVTATSYGTGDITLSGKCSSLNTDKKGTGDINTKGLKVNNGK